MTLIWTNERRKLSQLKPWERNPRHIKNKQAERLAESFDTFGQVETIAIGPEGEIYNGHQRLSVLAGQHGMDYEVDVRVSSRELSEKEREKLTVFLHRGATGEWNFDELANWELGELLEWGFDEVGEIIEASEKTSIGDPQSKPNNNRNLGDKHRQIKPVLYVDEIQDFERAIAATGLRNRGEAIISICKFYLENHDEEQAEGQFNISFENFAA